MVIFLSRLGVVVMIVLFLLSRGRVGIVDKEACVNVMLEGERDLTYLIGCDAADIEVSNGFTDLLPGLDRGLVWFGCMGHTRYCDPYWSFST